MVTSRKELFNTLNQPLDLIIIGGGITGAGIFLEATCRGFKAALIEQQDFAWGTSSRSSKLVHGGLRYLQQGNFKLTYEAVREREWMLEQLPGLVEPLPFVFPLYQGRKPSWFMLKIGLSLYDLFAQRAHHQYLDTHALGLRIPHLKQENLRGGYQYGDAHTDDARLTWRLIHEGIKRGGVAINYTTATEILRTQNGRVHGLQIQDNQTGHPQTLRAPLIINATGFWARQFISENKSFRLRPLRGSHLVLPGWKLPISHAIAATHPEDGRVVFILPWEGVTLVGTTDLDHHQSFHEEPFCTPEETRYLMAHLDFLFPDLRLKPQDILCTFAGVRPIVSTGKANPSAESRDHTVVDDQGLITVTGGKLTTWRLIAKDALKKATPYLPQTQMEQSKKAPCFGTPSIHELDNYPLPRIIKQKLVGRYGQEVFSVLDSRSLSKPADFVQVQDARVSRSAVYAEVNEHSRNERNAEIEQKMRFGKRSSEPLTFIPGTAYLWSELAWIATHEMIVHLDDWLLRRTRLGLLLPEGGALLFPRLKDIAKTHLGWDDLQWEKEVSRYIALWQKAYQPKIPSEAHSP